MAKHPENPSSKSSDKPSETRDTRERLLNAGKEVFARRGFDGATVKELAEVAGVNISLVSYHFEGKEGLFKACLEQFGQARLAAAQRMLRVPESIEDFRVRLKLFIEEFFDCYLENPEIITILHRECALDMPIARDVFENVFSKIFETFALFIKQAQKQGILRGDLDTLLTATLFYGSLVQMTRMEVIHERMYGRSIREKKYREQVIQHALRNFMDGVIA